VERKLEIREQSIPVEVEKKTEEQLEVKIGENYYKVEYTRISGNQIHLSINGRSINVFLADSQDGKIVFINGNTFTVTDGDNQVRNRKAKGRGDKTPDVVTPPMPARVVSVLVQDGDRIKKGDGVIVVSAMKMETTLTAPYDGRVIRVLVSQDDTVKPGDVLIDIEKDG
jgi:3-methylcrotonyl-CoA carboxylase alpha subunit